MRSGVERALREWELGDIAYKYHSIVEKNWALGPLNRFKSLTGKIIESAEDEITSGPTSIVFALLIILTSCNIEENDLENMQQLVFGPSAVTHPVPPAQRLAHTYAFIVHAAIDIRIGLEDKDLMHPRYIRLMEELVRTPADIREGGKARLAIIFSNLVGEINLRGTCDFALGLYRVINMNGDTSAISTAYGATKVELRAIEYAAGTADESEGQGGRRASW
ncbi:hypothetical protein BDY21DRAFT_360368 [Lineolata rhizophorae]|uniref:Uncharacterized protein n=1 Tax=Lineolata rhizophorae TaxID=578093 RepID=A0A6A6PEK8_9PEZI|nr:hypothetical protein BDY21DRAFT_360368 [Lineolata rhizophorae]